MKNNKMEDMPQVCLDCAVPQTLGVSCAKESGPDCGLTKAKHTPGPWKVQAEYDGTLPIDGWSEEAEESCEICRVSLDMLDTGERAANAALIAACPDLLDAMETLINLKDGEDDGGEGILESDWDKARAAIAKARGVK